MELVSDCPARLYGLCPRKGRLERGADADLVLVDPDAQRTLEDGAVVSKSMSCGARSHDRPSRAAHGLILHQREQAGRRTLSAGQLEERGEELNRACPLERAHVGGALDDHNPVAQQLAVDDEVL